MKKKSVIFKRKKGVGLKMKSKDLSVLRRKQPQEATLQTYVKEPEQISLVAASATPQSVLPPTTQVPQTIQDNTWSAVNIASTKLIKSASKTRQAFVTYETIVLEDTAERQQTKAKAQAANKEKKRQRQDRATFSKVDESSELSVVRESVQKRVATEPVVLPDVVHELEEHKQRTEQPELFAMTTTHRPSRATDQMIIETPPESQVLAYCNQFRGEMEWFTRMQNVVAENDGLKFQKTPVFRRSVLQTFLREPDPSCKWERPCYNLDRDPMPHERRIRCIAHRLWGFRLREMLFNDQQQKINASIRCGDDPSVHLFGMNEMCYLCHIYMANKACLDQKNNKEQRERTDLISVPSAPIMMRIVNRFMVIVDKPGEYDRRRMLVSDNVAMGVWGPFPIWNKDHYVPVRVVAPGSSVALRGVEESSKLLFQDARALAVQGTKGSLNKSTPSTPTSIERVVSTFRP